MERWALFLLSLGSLIVMVASQATDSFSVIILGLLVISGGIYILFKKRGTKNDHNKNR